MAQYVVAANEDSASQETAPDAAAAQATEDIQRADNYVVAVVLFAACLFFAGLSTRMRTITGRSVVLTLGLRPVRRHGGLGRHLPGDRHDLSSQSSVAPGAYYPRIARPPIMQPTSPSSSPRCSRCARKPASSRSARSPSTAPDLGRRRRSPRNLACSRAATWSARSGLATPSPPRGLPVEDLVSRKARGGSTPLSRTQSSRQAGPRAPAGVSRRGSGPRSPVRARSRSRRELS
jgi:hypothetical protein